MPRTSRCGPRTPLLFLRTTRYGSTSVHPSGGARMPERARPWIPLFLTIWLGATLLAGPLTAQPPAPAGDAKPAEADKGQDKDKKAVPEEKSSRTQHSITLDGQKIPYTATAGTTLLKDEDGTARATVFSIAYTRDGVKEPATRPVTF